MSVNIDDRYDSFNNPFFSNPFFLKREPGDFSPFYIAIGICTVFGVFLCVLNIFFCCCSKHRYYWQDSNTGNRWVLPIWNKSPHKQPPLDYTELDTAWLPSPVTEVIYPTPSPARTPVPSPRSGPSDYTELQKIESDI